MCDVAARCPKCKRDLAAYEVLCVVVDSSEAFNRPEHHFECPCGAVVHITEPAPGLVMTRQDAVFKP